MTLSEPPEDPHESEEGWEQCSVCKGTGVTMSAHAFEAYFVFSDEVEAREFSEGLDLPDGISSYGLRRVEPDEGLLGIRRSPSE